MILEEVKGKTKCDFAGCKNLADFVVSDASDNKKKMCFCDACLKEIYEIYAKFTVPKSVEAPFKKQKKLR